MLVLKKVFSNIKEGREHKKAEKQMEELRAAAVRAEQQREKAEAEKKALEDEKNRLRSLDEKGLMVELVFAVSGFCERMAALEETCQEIAYNIDSISSQISELEEKIIELENNMPDTSGS